MSKSLSEKIEIPKNMWKLKTTDFFKITKIYGLKNSEINKLLGRNPAYIYQLLKDKEYVPLIVIRKLIDKIKLEINVLSEILDEIHEQESKDRVKWEERNKLRMLNNE